LVGGPISVELATENPNAFEFPLVGTPSIIIPASSLLGQLLTCVKKTGQLGGAQEWNVFLQGVVKLELYQA
jgi:hypothetical protein